MLRLFVILLLIFLVPMAPHRALAKSGLVVGLKSGIETDFKGNNFKGVIERYRSYVKQNPEGHIPLVVQSYYSEALANVGEVDEAIEALRKMLKEFPPHLDPIRIQYHLAHLLFMENKQPEARAAYEKVVLMSKGHHELVAKAQDRLAKMKAKEVGRRDKVALELYDIESLLEAGEVPVGVEEYLNGIIAKRNSLRSGRDGNSDKAEELLARVKQIKDDKARALLNEARRLFDEERKYAEVREILEGILREFPTTNERQSVETLLQEVNRRLPKASNP